MGIPDQMDAHEPLKTVVPARSYDSLYTEASSRGEYSSCFCTFVPWSQSAYMVSIVSGYSKSGSFGIATAAQVDEAANSSIDVEKVKKDAKPAIPDSSQFPDGGTEAWLVTLGAWLVFFVCWGPINTIGIFQEYYQQNLLSGYSPSAIAWISSAKLFMMYAGGAIFGKLFDSYGPRWLLLVGSAMHVYGWMMTSISTQYYQIFLSQVICSAVGASCIYYACAGSIATWFLKKRSTAFGIAASGSSFGGVVLPIMAIKLIPRVGFPWTMRIIGFVILGMVIVINYTVKSRIKHIPKPFRVSDYTEPFKEPTFGLFALSLTVVVFGLFRPFNFLVLQAQSRGMSRSLSEYLVRILNAARYAVMLYRPRSLADQALRAQYPRSHISRSTRGQNG